MKNLYLRLSGSLKTAYCILCLVLKVQGVSKRYGSVEALLSGTPAAVDEMLVLLEVGPPAARVDRVTVVAEGGTSPAGFEARV